MACPLSKLKVNWTCCRGFTIQAKIFLPGGETPPPTKLCRSVRRGGGVAPTLKWRPIFHACLPPFFSFERLCLHLCCFISLKYSQILSNTLKYGRVVSSANRMSSDEYIFVYPCYISIIIFRLCAYLFAPIWPPFSINLCHFCFVPLFTILLVLSLCRANFGWMNSSHAIFEPEFSIECGVYPSTWLSLTFMESNPLSEVD